MRPEFASEGFLSGTNACSPLSNAGLCDPAIGLDTTVTDERDFPCRGVAGKCAPESSPTARRRSGGV